MVSGAFQGIQGSFKVVCGDLKSVSEEYQEVSGASEGTMKPQRWALQGVFRVLRGARGFREIVGGLNLHEISGTFQGPSAAL